MKIAIIRGRHLNKWEMQNYEPLTSRADVTAFASKQSLYPLDDLHLPVMRLPSVDQRLDRSPILRATLGWPIWRRLDHEHLIGLESTLQSYDIAHGAETYFKFTWQAAQAQTRHGVKLVTTCWETIPFAHSDTPVMRWRKRYIQNNADLFLAMSPRAADALRIEGVEKQRIQVLFPGVNLQHFRPLARQAKDGFDLWRRNDALRVLFVGRIDVSKGIRDLILAASDIARMPEFANRVEFGLVGNGDIGLVRHMVEAMRLQNVVNYHPAIPYGAMPSLYASADVFVLPSLPTPYWEEQFGMVLVESMACGKAIISTHSGAIPDVVGDAGVLVAPYDYKALARGIADLLADTRLRCQLSTRAVERARDTFDSRVFAERVHAIYEDLLS